MIFPRTYTTKKFFTLLLFFVPVYSNPGLVRQLLYTDLIIDDPRIAALITTQAFTRLENVLQYGIDSQVLPDCKHTACYNRAVHSLGVYYLLCRYHAPFEEQVAGLLHDASHTAFSHVGDHVFMHKDGKSSYQDDHHIEFLRETDIPEVLRTFGLELHAIDHKKAEFTCLEQPLPELCADRLEYNLSGGILEKLITPEEARSLLDHLRFDDNRWYFIDVQYAKKFAHISLWHTEHIWGCPMSSYVSQHLAHAIRQAFERDILTPKEFIHGTDHAIWEKLCGCTDLQIQACLEKIIHAWRYEKQICKEPRTNKFRGINPWVLVDGSFKRLTELDADFAHEYQRIKLESYS